MWKDMEKHIDVKIRLKGSRWKDMEKHIDVKIRLKGDSDKKDMERLLYHIHETCISLGYHVSSLDRTITHTFSTSKDFISEEDIS